MTPDQLKARIREGGGEGWEVSYPCGGEVHILYAQIESEAPTLRKRAFLAVRRLDEADSMRWAWTMRLNSEWTYESTVGSLMGGKQQALKTLEIYLSALEREGGA